MALDGVVDGIQVGVGAVRGSVEHVTDEIAAGVDGLLPGGRASGYWSFLNEKSSCNRKLKEQEDLINKVQAVILWRNLVGLAFAVVLVNVYFIFWKVLGLGGVGALVLIIVFYVILGLGDALGVLGKIFPKVDESGRPDQSNHLRTIGEITNVVQPVGKWIYNFVAKILAKAALTAAYFVNVAILLGVLLATKILCRGTLWVIADLVLIVPGLLLFPPVYPYVQRGVRAAKDKLGKA